MKVSTILSKKRGGVITIHPAQTVREAIGLMTQHNIGALIVVDKPNHIVGVVSERDVIRRVAGETDLLSWPVSELMTTRVITGVPQDELISVAHTMTERRFRHLPILERGELIGIVSIGDVLKAQRDSYKGEIDTLETQLMAGNN